MSATTTQPGQAANEREKGTLLNSTCLTPKPLAPSVYVHVPEAHSAHERSIERSMSVMSLFSPAKFMSVRGNQKKPSIVHQTTASPLV